MTKDDKSARNEAVPQDKKNSWPKLTWGERYDAVAAIDEIAKRKPPEEDVVGEEPAAGGEVPTLGAIAQKLLPLHNAGVTRGSMLYVVDKVWYEEAEEEARASLAAHRLAESSDQGLLAYPGQVPGDRLIAYNPGPDHLAAASEKVRQAWLAAHPNLVDQWKLGAVETALQKSGYNPADAPTTTLLWEELVGAARVQAETESAQNAPVFLPKGQLPEIGSTIRLHRSPVEGVVSGLDKLNNEVLLSGHDLWWDLDDDDVTSIEVLSPGDPNLRKMRAWWDALVDEPEITDFERLLAQLGLRGEKA